MMLRRLTHQLQFGLVNPLSGLPELTALGRDLFVHGYLRSVADTEACPLGENKPSYSNVEQEYLFLPLVLQE